jgi:16S rRNA (cytosine1402-N4)-methyltransferase
MSKAAPDSVHRTVPPADSHTTVLLAEAIDALVTNPSGIYVDGTFGRGGHTRLLLQKLAPDARLIALDRDLQAIAAARQISDPRFTIVHAPFSELAQHVHMPIDGLLLDIGISSPQIDTPERGFSFRFDAPLDMRMDTTRGPTVAQWLQTAEQEQIREIIDGYGEERFAARIAAAIVARRAVEPITTTGQLARLVAGAVKTREKGQDPATRTFQALRIFINRELEELGAVLAQAQRLIKQDGRLVVISFHSLEDRIVKQALTPPRMDPALRHLPVRGDGAAQGAWKPLAKIKPSAAELRANPRARSAIMRVAERTSAAAVEVRS